MSFKLFEIDFDGKKDSFEIGKEKMDKVCKIVGKNFIKQWFLYCEEKGRIKVGNIEDYYKSLKVLEDCDFRDIRDDLI